MQNTFRHGIIQHQQSVGVQTFLSYTGGFVNLHVANKHLTYTISQGSADYLFSEISDTLEAWEVNQSVQTWLGINIDLIDGERQFITTIVEPIVSTSQPAGVVGLYWFDLNTTTMKRWTGSRFAPTLTLFVASTQLGQFSPLVNLSTYVGSTVGINTQCNPGAVLFDESGRLLYKSDGTILTTEDRMSSAVHKSSHVKVGSIGFLSIAGENIPRHHMVVLRQDGRVYLSDGSDVGSHLHGLVEYDHNIGDVLRVCTEGYFEDPLWNWQVIGRAVYANHTGRLTDTPSNKYIPIGYVVSNKAIHMNNIGQYHVHPILGTGQKGDKGDVGPQGLKGEPGSGGVGGSGSGFIMRTGGSTKAQLGINLAAYATESVSNGEYVYAPDAEFDLVLRTSEYGAITAEYSGNYDGVQGRNTRGTQSLDLQRAASSATMVASGTQSTILNGQNNTASGLRSTVVNGNNNIVAAQDSVILSGFNNQILGDAYSSTIIGSSGSIVNDAYRSIVIGGNNVAINDGYQFFSFGDRNVSTPENNFIYSGISFNNDSCTFGGQTLMANSRDIRGTVGSGLITNSRNITGQFSDAFVHGSQDCTLNGSDIVCIGSNNVVHTDGNADFSRDLDKILSLFSFNENIQLTETGSTSASRIGSVFGLGMNLTNCWNVFSTLSGGTYTNSHNHIALRSGDFVTDSRYCTSIGSTFTTFIDASRVTNFGDTNQIRNVDGGVVMGNGARHHVNGACTRASNSPAGFRQYTGVNEYKRAGQAQAYDVILTGSAMQLNDLNSTIMTLRTDHVDLEFQKPEHEINILEDSTILITGNIISASDSDSYDWTVRILCERRGSGTPTILHQSIQGVRGASGTFTVSVVNSIIRITCTKWVGVGAFVVADLHVTEMRN